MSTILLILAAVCLIIGFAGCIIPIIPGPPIAFVGIILLQFTPHAISWSLFTTLLILAIAVTLLDYAIPGWGTKKFGGSKLGTMGCMIGTIAGLFVLPPLGIIIMPFLGALLGELLNGTQPIGMLKAAVGALVGFLTGIVMKFAVSIVFIIVYIQAIFS